MAGPEVQNASKFVLEVKSFLFFFKCFSSLQAFALERQNRPLDPRMSGLGHSAQTNLKSSLNFFEIADCGVGRAFHSAPFYFCLLYYLI